MTKIINEEIVLDPEESRRFIHNMTHPDMKAIAKRDDFLMSITPTIDIPSIKTGEDNTMEPESRTEFIVRRTTHRKGGFREKEIFSRPHTIVQSETWNDEHKVVHIISDIEDTSGHKDSYSVDIVTESICG